MTTNDDAALAQDGDDDDLPGRISKWLSLPALDLEADVAFSADMLGEAESEILTLRRLLYAARDALRERDARIAEMREYAHTTSMLADAWTPLEDFTPGPQIRVYYYSDAPQEWQDLSTHGGDEDFLTYIPKERRESELAYRVSQEGAFGRWFVSEHELPDGALIVIHAHA